MSAVQNPGFMSNVPLVVDLDGTLLRSDLLVESFLACLVVRPLAALRALCALRRGKANMKCALAQSVVIDPETLPYDERVLTEIRKARCNGAPVYLASASHESFVSAVAAHLDLFDGWMASDGERNLSGSEKARLLVERFGRGGFDYFGNDQADLDVWPLARRKFAMQPSAGVARRLLVIDPDASIVSKVQTGWKNWTRLLRVHQYVKNVLLFVPLLTSHSFGWNALANAAIAFLSFSLCASSVYVLNDLIDIPADRRHSTKCRRPLAAGTVGILAAALAVALLAIASFLISALFLPSVFSLTLLAYLGLTTAYTFFLKRKMIVDVVVLAMLYTIRVIAGGAAIGVAISEWLLAFSMFFFMSLALIKRYVELTDHLDMQNQGPAGPANRNYRTDDLNIVAALIAASGLNSVTVFALYASSSAVDKLYNHPERLWLICPILMYWLARTLVLAQRRLIHDDPVVFAMKDRNSLLAGALILLVVLIATL